MTRLLDLVGIMVEFCLQHRQRPRPSKRKVWSPVFLSRK